MRFRHISLLILLAATYIVSIGLMGCSSWQTYPSDDRDACESKFLNNKNLTKSEKSFLIDGCYEVWKSRMGL